MGVFVCVFPGSFKENTGFCGREREGALSGKAFVEVFFVVFSGETEYGGLEFPCVERIVCGVRARGTFGTGRNGVYFQVPFIFGVALGAIAKEWAEVII